MLTLSPVETLKKGSLEEVKKLLKNYRFPDHVIDGYYLNKYKRVNLDKRAMSLHSRKSPLHYSALNNDPKIIDYLLEELCKIHGDPKVKKERVERELDLLNKTDEEGRTALHHAALNKEQTMIDFILKRLCKLESFLKEETNEDLLKEKFLNKVDKEGYNPLMLAVQEGNFSVIKYLIENGADYKAINLCGLDIIGILKHNKHYSIIPKVKAIIDEQPCKVEITSQNLNSTIVQRNTNFFQPTPSSLSTSSQLPSVSEKEGKISTTNLIASWLNFGFFSTNTEDSSNTKNSKKEVTQPLLPKIKTL